MRQTEIIGPMQDNDFTKRIVDKIERPRVAFDFDGTLELPYTQKYAKWLIDIGVEVHIVTSRYESWDAAPDDHKDQYLRLYPTETGVNFNQDLFKVVKKLGVSAVHFTNYEDKVEFFNSMIDMFVFHLDDANFELRKIQEGNANVIPIKITGDWINKCNRALKRHGWFPVAPDDVSVGDKLWYYNKASKNSFKRGIVTVEELDGNNIVINEDGNRYKLIYSNQDVGLPMKTWEFFNLMKIDSLPF